MTGSIVVPFDFRTLIAYDATVSLSFTLLQLIRERVTQLDTSIESIEKGKSIRTSRTGLAVRAPDSRVYPRSGTLNPSLTDQTNPYAESAMNGESKE